jgi:hypothetical protein
MHGYRFWRRTCRRSAKKRPSEDDGGIRLHPDESLFERFLAIAALSF